MMFHSVPDGLGVGRFAAARTLAAVPPAAKRKNVTVTKKLEVELFHIVTV
jgi:hypothetical protein